MATSALLSPKTASRPARCRAWPKAVYLTTGDEHTEEGHITEDAGISAAMLEKRLRKEG